MRTYPSSEDVQGTTYSYYPGRWIQFQDRTYSAQFPHQREHSLPSCPSGKYHILHIVPVPIYTPGWRAAMWIKCLAEGQKCQALTGIEPATLWSRVKGSLQYNTAPPLCIFITGAMDIILIPKLIIWRFYFGKLPTSSLVPYWYIFFVFSQFLKYRYRKKISRTQRHFDFFL